MNAIVRMRAIALTAFAALAIVAPSTARAASVTTHNAGVMTAEQVAGVYRLILGAENRGSRVVHLLLQQTARGFDGMLLSDANDTALSDVKFDGSTLTATAQTSGGKGTLHLTMSEHGVTGTFTVGKRTFAVNGEKA